MNSSTYFQQDKVKSDLSFGQLLKRLLPYFLRHKRMFWTTLFSIVLLAFVGRVLPTLFGYAIDEGLQKKNLQVTLVIAGIYFGLEVVRGLLMFLHRYLFFRMGNKILFEIREELLAHIQRLPIPFFDRNPSGRIVTRATNDVVALGDLFTQGLIGVFTQLLSIVFIFGAMMLISVKLTLVTLLVTPVLVWLSLKLSQAIRVNLRETKRKLAMINAFVAEMINGMKILQLYNRVPKTQDRFNDMSEDYRNIQLRTVRLYALLWPMMNFFNACAIVTALFYGGYLNSLGAIQIGALIAFIMHVQDFIQPLRFILEKYQQFQNSLTGAERIFQLLEEKPESFPLGSIPGEIRLNGEIEYRGLHFRYRTEGDWVLNNINLKIAAGQSVALVGRTGSGKSSMIALLQRFYDYNEGEICIDGTPLSLLPKRALRKRIGVVQQDPFLFRGTLRENISLGNPDLTEKDIIKAARQAQCHHLLERDKGLDTFVEERGQNLSLGERQLIAFARVLAFNPDILILDEATANIDSQSEKAIQKAIQVATHNRTSIIIAHRLSTIQRSDLIVVLDHGEIIEAGSHSELLAQNGAYHRMYTSQAAQSQVSPSKPVLVEAN